MALQVFRFYFVYMAHVSFSTLTCEETPRVHTITLVTCEDTTRVHAITLVTCEETTRVHTITFVR